MSADSLLRTPLHERHVDAGGRMVPFAGYEMPVQYASMIAEAKAVREGAGMFDVSHMARLSIVGAGAYDFLERVTANDVAKLEPLMGQYSLLPNPEGGVVDDIIVYRTDGLTSGPWRPSEPGIGERQDFRMVVNASNHAKDVAWLHLQNMEGVQITDQTDVTAMIAVQGPSAASIVSRLAADSQAIADAPFFGVVVTEIASVPCFAARSGYTGEDGYELICASDAAKTLWDALAKAGVVACGLAARDALRVEAGLPLYGHELNDELSPIAAGLGWVISKTKQFIGSERINEARASGTPKKLQGIRLDSKRLITPGMAVYVGGRQVGEVTSGVYSPLVDRGIAFALLDAEVGLETPCEIEVRGKMEPGMVVSKRFYKRPK